MKELGRNGAAWHGLRRSETVSLWFSTLVFLLLLSVIVRNEPEISSLIVVFPVAVVVMAVAGVAEGLVAAALGLLISFAFLSRQALFSFQTLMALLVLTSSLGVLAVFFRRLRRQLTTTTELAEHSRARDFLQAIYDASAEGLVLCRAIRNTDGRVVDYQALEVNRAHAVLTGADRQVMLCKTISGVSPSFDKRWLATAETAIRTGEMQQFDIRSPQNGRWLNIRVSPVSGDLFQQTFIDISSRYEAEERRRDLLSEMNHRIKNHLQMVASFLKSDIRQTSGETRLVFEKASQRVLVLAGLHGHLAQQPAAEVDAAAYVDRLCTYLAALNERPDAVDFTWRCDTIVLSSEKAVAIGFILGELVTNALKYAFIGQGSGKIIVDLHKEGDDVFLRIQDDGRGLSVATQEFGETSGLATQIVKAFIEKLGASLSTTSKAGVCHTIRFALSEESSTQASRDERQFAGAV